MRNLEWLKTAVRFGCVGGLVFGVDVGALWCLEACLPWIPAVTVAYLLAVAVHFTLNRSWVFESRNQTLSRQLIRYAVTVFLCWSSTVGLVALSLRTVTGSVVIAKVLAVPVVTLLGFALMKWYVFVERPA
jgi:putative flippase GtrA